jgi:type IV pilus assembly protein PilQ
MVMLCFAGRAAAQTPGSVQPKDNPFESVLKKQQYAATQGGGGLAQEGLSASDLSVETVKLEFVDAVTASQAFSCLCSELGKIVPREPGNSLIVFDTPENVKRIVEEIKKSDRPIESVTLQYVGLTHMDANDVQGAVASLASPAGRIIGIGKTNGLILCDTKINVAAMLKEIEKLDQPTAGLQALPITFDHIDAMSAKTALTNMLSTFGTISVVERTNSIVVCDVPKNLKEIAKEAKSLDCKTPGLVVETVNLKFLQAKNMVEVLSKMLTQYGSVASNEATNTVLLCDTQENVTRIISQIKKADQTPPQFMVEAVLLDVRLGDDKEIGINWNGVSTDYRERTGGDYNSDGSATIIPFDSNRRVGAGAGFDAANLGGTVNVISGSINALVSAIQTTRDVQVIASPRALVLSGKTATILAAEQIPYEERSETSQGGSMTSTSFKEVGVTLIVGAVLTDNGEIMLNVDIEQSVRTGESLAGVPVVDTRSEDTSLLLRDGQVVIMGGLRRREKTVQVTKVPLLGDLPLLGNLFRTRHDVVSNSELVVLLAPHIYKGEPVPQKVIDECNELLEHSPVTGSVSLPKTLAKQSSRK